MNRTLTLEQTKRITDAMEILGSGGEIVVTGSSWPDVIEELELLAMYKAAHKARRLNSWVEHLLGGRRPRVKHKKKETT